MENEKKYVKPEADIIEFNNEDIIVTSGEGDIGGINYPWWGNGGFPGGDTGDR